MKRPVIACSSLLTIALLTGCEKQTEYVNVQQACVYPVIDEMVLAKGLRDTEISNDTYASELLRLDNEIKQVNLRYKTLHEQYPKKVD